MTSHWTTLLLKKRRKASIQPLSTPPQGPFEQHVICKSILKFIFRPPPLNSSISNSNLVNCRLCHLLLILLLLLLHMLLLLLLQYVTATTTTTCHYHQSF